MAGHGYTKRDVAIDRWNFVREDAFRHFRFTNRATLQVMGLLSVPVAIYYLASVTDRTLDWRGKAKGESLES